MPTLSKLITELSEKYDTGKRPLHYFDVKKRGELSSSEVRYVKKRFKEFVDREKCVEKDPTNPKCYAQVKTDKKPKKKKRKSSYLADYEEVFRNHGYSTAQFDKVYAAQIAKLKKQVKSAPKGLVRVAIETGLPLKALKEVYDIGRGAYASSGSRTGMASEQWGYGRVYAFIMSYFMNEDGRYDQSRFLKNKTDFHVLQEIIDSGW